MKVYQYYDGQTGYVDLVTQVREHSIGRAPRGLKTYDAGPVTVRLISPWYALPLGTGRNLNTKIAAVEALQLIGAFSDPDLVDYASPNFEPFKESDGSFYGSYGARISDQLPNAVHKLKTDKDTRQAVITLWDPRKDNVPGKKDYPCTVALNLAIVHDLLELRVLMRSNDVWRGTPYDWFQFTQLQLVVANALGIAPGPYTHTTWSLHLYETDVERSHELHQPEKPLPEVYPKIGKLGEDTLELMIQARGLARRGPLLRRKRTESELWYRQVLSRD